MCGQEFLGEKGHADLFQCHVDIRVDVLDQRHSPCVCGKKMRRVWQFPDVHFSVIRDFSFIFGFGLDDSLLFGFPLS